MTERERVAITPEYVAAILAAVERRGVLVGGQALAVWISVFGLDRHVPSTAPISIDADFLGNRELVTEINSHIPGSTVHYQIRSAISRLVGVVEIPLSNDKFMSVDVIDTVPPLDEKSVFDRAVEMLSPDNTKYLVLHPVHLLASRAHNLANFEEKKTQNGVEQLALTVRVVHAYLASALTNDAMERKVLKIIEEIVRIAKGPAGAAAKSYGINFLDAMPLDLIKNENFQSIRRQQIALELEAVKPPAYLLDQKFTT